MMQTLSSRTGIWVHALLVLLVVGWSWGCLAGSTMITARGLDGGAVKLSREELTRLAGAIEGELRNRDRSLSTVDNLAGRHGAGDSFGDGNNVLAEFTSGNRGLKIFLVEKVDRTFVVFVNTQGGWPLSVPQANSFADVVSRAIAEALPGHEVVVERRVGLDLR